MAHSTSLEITSASIGTAQCYHEDPRQQPHKDHTACGTISTAYQAGGTWDEMAEDRWEKVADHSTKEPGGATEPANDADESSNVMDMLKSSASQEFTGRSVVDLEQMMNQRREAPTPDILATLELLDDDPERLHTSQDNLGEEQYPCPFPQMSHGFSPVAGPEGQRAANVSAEVAQTLTRIRTMEHEKLSLGEVIRGNIVPAITEEANRATMLMQPKTPYHSGSKQAATKPSAPATTKKKPKKRRGRGSYKCTLCGAKKENHICRAVSIAEAGTQTVEIMSLDEISNGCKTIAVGMYHPADDEAKEGRHTLAKPDQKKLELPTGASWTQISDAWSIQGGQAPFTYKMTLYIDSDEEIESVPV